MFWIGVFISFAVSFINGLSQRVPAVPAIPLGPVALMQWVRVGPLAGLGELDLVLWPWMIAIAYLIPKELSFSAWFFWLVQVGLTVAAIAAGAAPQRPEEWFDSSFPAPRYQGGGAVLALGIWALWIARPHIVRALRLAISGRSGKAYAGAQSVSPRLIRRSRSSGARTAAAISSSGSGDICALGVAGMPLHGSSSTA